MAKTKNGVAAKTVDAAPAAPVPTPDLAGIVLSEDERAELAKLEREALGYKVALADLDMQIARFEQNRADLRQKVGEASKAYVDQVVAAASTHGIDLNDKTVRWNFDTSKMTFTRQG